MAASTDPEDFRAERTMVSSPGPLHMSDLDMR